MLAWVCSAVCGVSLHLYPADLDGYFYNLNLNGEIFAKGLNQKQAHHISYKFWSNTDFECKNIGHGN